MERGFDINTGVNHVVDGDFGNSIVIGMLGQLLQGREIGVYGCMAVSCMGLRDNQATPKQTCNKPLHQDAQTDF